MTRRALIAGNWKLHHSLAASESLARAIREGVGATPRCDVAVAPVSTSIARVAAALAGSPVRVAAQSCYEVDQGAFTGEVSVPLLADAGATMCIVGHSERRQLFGETDESVARKTAAVLRHGLTAIVCIGETLEQREAGATLDVVLGQLDAALDGLPDAELARVTIAYEPVWAIGTGRNARPEDAQAVHAAIRKRVAERRNATVAPALRVLYGGSVKPDNAASLLAQPDVDGALVGGASLEAAPFLSIVRAAESLAAEARS